MRLAKNQNIETVKVGQWVLYQFQWYIVESIDVETGESCNAMPSQLDGLGG